MLYADRINYIIGTVILFNGFIFLNNAVNIMRCELTFIPISVYTVPLYGKKMIYLIVIIIFDCRRQIFLQINAYIYVHISTIVHVNLLVLGISFSRKIMKILQINSND